MLTLTPWYYYNSVYLGFFGCKNNTKQDKFVDINIKQKETQIGNGISYFFIFIILEEGCFLHKSRTHFGCYQCEVINLQHLV